MPDADPARYVRGQYEGYRAIDGVAPDSTTETSAALHLEIDNWRWSGVPIYIRTGSGFPSARPSCGWSSGARRGCASPSASAARSRVNSW
jgi:hypothetical protein